MLGLISDAKTRADVPPPRAKSSFRALPFTRSGVSPERLVYLGGRRIVKMGGKILERALPLDIWKFKIILGHHICRGMHTAHSLARPRSCHEVRGRGGF